MRRLLPFFTLIRPHDCFAATLATFLGGYLAGKRPSDWVTISLLIAGATVWLIAAAGDVVNDIHDQPVDSLNKSYRPIPAGKVSRRAASLLAGALILAGLICAWLLAPISLVIASLACLLGILYSLYLKSTVLLGNCVVGLLAGLTVIFGSLSVGEMNPAVVFAALLIFLFVFSREILKTVADKNDDAQVGLRTVATELGALTALRIFHITALFMALFALVPWLLYQAPNVYLIAIIILLILPILSVQLWLKQRYSEATLNSSLRLTKFVWFSGLLALLFLK